MKKSSVVVTPRDVPVVDTSPQTGIIWWQIGEKCLEPSSRNHTIRRRAVGGLTIMAKRTGFQLVHARSNNVFVQKYKGVQGFLLL